MARQAIAHSTNVQRSKPLDAARLVNLLPEQPPLGSRAPSLQVGIASPIKSVLYGTPGLSVWQTLGSGKARAARYALGYFWVLYGPTLYRIEQDGTSTICVGDTIPPSGRAMMSDNGVQLVVQSGTEMFVVGGINATGSFRVTGGTNIAGTNKIDSVEVNSVVVTGGAIDWADSNEAVAGAIAQSINDFASSPEYSASTNGATVIIKADVAGTAPNGLGIVINVAGDVTVTPPSSSMSGGAASSTHVTQVTNVNFPEAGISSLDYVDGYIVFTVAVSDTNNREWGITSLVDATNLDPLDFARAESTPSNLLRVLVNYEEVWLFSATGISVWRNTGASPFAFERIPGAVMERGTAAAMSPAKLNNVVYWLGDDKKVYAAQGYQPTRISTHGLEEDLRKAGDVSDATGMTYSMGGHDFYVLTVPGANKTYTFDAATQGWHERQSGTSIDPMPWLVRWLAPAWGKVYAGLDSGRLCELDLDTYADADAPIRRVAVTPPLFSDGKRAIVTALEIECELGVGLSAGQGSAPECMMRWSDDGGATWSNERRAPLGPMGKRKTRAIFRKLGVFRQRMFEFSISDPVKIAAYGMRYEGFGATSA